MRKALEVPMRKIASNAGEDGAVIIENVRRLQKSRKDTRVGYNVMTNEYVNMIEAGVPDPAKVTRGAVENAASIASMILTTEALITDIPEDDKVPPGGDMGGTWVALKHSSQTSQRMTKCRQALIWVAWVAWVA